MGHTWGTDSRVEEASLDPLQASGIPTVISKRPGEPGTTFTIQTGLGISMNVCCICTRCCGQFVLLPVWSVPWHPLGKRHSVVTPRSLEWI